jgi:hypothetical protein
MRLVQIDIQPMLDRDYSLGTNPVRSTVGRYAASPMSVSHPTTSRRPAGMSVSLNEIVRSRLRRGGLRSMCRPGVGTPPADRLAVAHRRPGGVAWPPGRSRSAPRRRSTAGTGWPDTGWPDRRHPTSHWVGSYRSTTLICSQGAGTLRFRAKGRSCALGDETVRLVHSGHEAGFENAISPEAVGHPLRPGTLTSLPSRVWAGALAALAPGDSGTERTSRN